MEGLRTVPVLGIVIAGDGALHEVENNVVKSTQFVLCTTDSAVLLVEVGEDLCPQLAVGAEDGYDVLGSRIDLTGAK